MARHPHVETLARRPRAHLPRAGAGLVALALVSCSDSSTPVIPDDVSPYVERIFLRDKLNTPVSTGMGMDAAALEYVRGQYESIGGLSEDTGFVVLSAKVGMDGRHHVRLAQTYRDVRIWGADVVVHAAEDRFRALNGTIVKGLDGFDLSSSVSADEAFTTSRDDYATLAKDDTPLDYAREASELVIIPLDDRTVKLAWHISFFTELQAGITPGLWHYFIDARSGDILSRQNGIHAAVVQASGPGGNENGTRSWVEALDVEDLGEGRGRMHTATLITRDMQGETRGEGLVVEGEIASFGDPAVNDAHAFAEITLQMLRGWYDIDSLDGQGMVVESRVHYGVDFDNAFWDGQRVTYGDGGALYYPLSGAIDVVAHELHHGFTDHHARLLPTGQAAAVRESFADIGATITEFYWLNEGADWEIGRDVMLVAGAMRYLCDPAADGVSIAHAGDYSTGLEPHHAAGVMNRAFCRAARRLAGAGADEGAATPESVRRVGEAFYLANASYWTSSTTFHQACQGVLEAADALGFSAGEKRALNQSWQDVGVVCGEAVRVVGCDERLTAESGTISSPGYPASYPNNLRYTWCIAPASGQPATLTFAAVDTEPDYDVIEVRGANNTVLATTSGGRVPPPVSSAMLAITFATDGSVTRSGFTATWSTGEVYNVPPVVSIIVPSAGAEVSGEVIVGAFANDQDGSIAQVVFELPDGTSVTDTTSPYSITWDSTRVFDGPATIRAVAMDDLGTQSLPAEVSVIIANGISCAQGVFRATDVPLTIPDYDAIGVTSTIAIDDPGGVHYLRLSLNISHTYRGDLAVTLTSPSGTIYTVHNRTGDSQRNLVITDLLLPTFSGEPIEGPWRLQVRDLAKQDRGKLESWSLTAACPTPGGWLASASPRVSLVDNGEVCSTLSVAQPGDAADVQLDVYGEHTYRSSLRATLSHNGVQREAFAQGHFPTQGGTFQFVNRPISGFSGDAAGSWTLCIIDTDGYSDTGLLHSWSVHN